MLPEIAEKNRLSVWLRWAATGLIYGCCVTNIVAMTKKDSCSFYLGNLLHFHGHFDADNDIDNDADKHYVNDCNKLSIILIIITVNYNKIIVIIKAKKI